MGIVPFSDIERRMQALAVRIDGSRCYSTEMGGIYAEGCFDLGGPDLLGADDESANAAVAFTRIGDIIYGSEANNEALLEYNIANTGP